MATVPWSQMRGRKTVSGLILHKLLLWNWTNMGCTLPVLTLRFSESMLLFGHVWAYLVQLDRLASVIPTQMDKRNAFVQFFSLEQELTVRVTQGVYEEWNSWLCSLSHKKSKLPTDATYNIGSLLKYILCTLCYIIFTHYTISIKVKIQNL